MPCPERLSLPSGLDVEASSNWIFRGRLTKDQSGNDPTLDISCTDTLYNGLGDKVVRKRQRGLKRDPGWPYPKTRKYRKEAAYCYSRLHDPLRLRCSCLLQSVMVSLAVTVGVSPAVLSAGFRSRTWSTLLQPSGVALVAPNGSAIKEALAKRLCSFPYPWYLSQQQYRSPKISTKNTSSLKAELFFRNRTCHS